jgi:hypothetical protein
MNPILRNILAVIVGLVIGGALNMSLIMVSGHIIPPPEGADITTEAGLKAAMPFMQPKHFLFPFLAHALGTFVGALLAALIAANNKMRFAFAISIVFLVGGIANVMILPSPMWFNVLDLGFAYIPMGYLAGKIASKA